MKIEESTKIKFEKIWNGLDYHVNELSRFFLENEDDPFLKTDYGKKMEEYSKSICAACILGKVTMARNKVSDLMTRMMCVDDEEPKKTKETKKPEEGKETFSMEDMLKSVFGMNDKKDEGA